MWWGIPRGSTQRWCYTFSLYAHLRKAKGRQCVPSVPCSEAHEAQYIWTVFGTLSKENEKLALPNSFMADFEIYSRVG